MRRVLTVLCCILTLWATNPIQAQEISSIELVVQSGDAVPDDISSWEVAVVVQDNNGRKVQGALVVFQVPPGFGSFAGGLTTVTVATDENGRASARFKRGAVAGPFQINVSGSYKGHSVNSILKQVNPKLSFMATPKKWWVIGGSGAAVAGIGLGIWWSQRSTGTSISLGSGNVGPGK